MKWTRSCCIIPIALFVILAQGCLPGKRAPLVPNHPRNDLESDAVGGDNSTPDIPDDQDEPAGDKKSETPGEVTDIADDVTEEVDDIIDAKESPVCGNGKCEKGETQDNCPKDCKCGDQVCDEGEGGPNGTCRQDCPGCGDGLCSGDEYWWDSESEIYITDCPGDCLDYVACGNGICEPGEWPDCPDCVPTGCGNGLCEDKGENYESCPIDCAEACGNGKCESTSEDMEKCPADCGYCGDGICQAIEYSTDDKCLLDCTAGCGDGTCSGSETALDCPSDCKACIPNCSGKEYGADGCGGCCQSCPEFEECQGGLCVGELAIVPKGTFYMGCNKTKDDTCEDEEKPQHMVTIKYDYGIETTEVTNRAYALFLNANGNTCPGKDGGDEENCVNATKAQLSDSGGEGWQPLPDMESHPVVGVSVYGAKTYCKWLGRRLCSETEWEKAARGDCDQLFSNLDQCGAAMPIYPWGDDDPSADCTLANWAGGGCSGLNPGTTEPVGSHSTGVSQFISVHDMAGNVAELTSDCWHNQYGGDMPDDGSPWQTSCDMSSVTVRKGGCYNGISLCDIRSSARDYLVNDETSAVTGFRCCKNLEE